MTDPNLSRNFLHACQNGDLSRVETLVSKYDIQDWTYFRHLTSGDTALHVATREGHLNIVRYLCENFQKPDFRVNVANKDMKRPLHEAAQFAHRDIVKYLIKKGADVDALKRADWTPLMLACTKTGNDAYECILALLEAKANPLLRNKDGWTPLHLICRSGDENAFDLLVNQFAESINDRSNNGRTVMHIAAFHGHEGLVNRLVSLNTNFLNVRDSSGSAPLHEAIKGGHISVAKRLIDLGADVQATDNVGQTSLHIAAIVGNVETFRNVLRN
ncbi:hypothetical protein K0M31_003928 [Melipona bicolor]|uniref:Ankyrin repeat domain-containing protein 16 n=1 Tax=Melipona bicolor TaxID=60889 RepID=A0AA40FXW0_9HYME|nr:hypothetical protein K0M31_003928 [Melipona bicolor]